MSGQGTFRRSAAGQLALDTRDKRLGARLRALMLMAEGKPLARFDEMASALGAPADALAQLRSFGFVAEEGGAPATSPAAKPIAPAAPALTPGAPRDEQAAAVPEAADVQDGGSHVYDHFRTASGMMRELASDTMGLKAFFYILKIDKCGTLAELEALLPDLLPAVRRQRGNKEADAIENRFRSLLSGDGG